jgi:uncharacterized membrane protein YgcG
MMKKGMKMAAMLGKSMVLNAAFAVAAAAASAQTALPSDTAAKAGAFKMADSQYIKALCDGSRSERSDALTARARARDDLERSIVDAAAQTAEVQKALSAAADAGEAADKIAADPGATDRDKSATQDKFRQAKADLQQILAAQRNSMEAKISQDLGVNFEAAGDCPNPPKAAERPKAAPARAVRSSGDGGRQVREQRQSAGSGAPVPAVTFGGGGLSIGGGGVSVTFGR